MSVGSIVALPITPYIADIAGRRAGVMTGCIIMIIGVVLQSIGVNISMFIAARFLIGFGVAIAHGAAPLLIAELVHPQHRAIFTTIYNSTWYLGSIVAAVSTNYMCSQSLCYSQSIYMPWPRDLRNYANSRSSSGSPMVRSLKFDVQS